VTPNCPKPSPTFFELGWQMTIAKLSCWYYSPSQANLQEPQPQLLTSTNWVSLVGVFFLYLVFCVLYSLRSLCFLIICTYCIRPMSPCICICQHNVCVWYILIKGYLLTLPSPAAAHHRTLAGTHFSSRWGQEAELAWVVGYMPRWYARPKTVTHIPG